MKSPLIVLLLTTPLLVQGLHGGVPATTKDAGYPVAAECPCFSYVEALDVFDHGPALDRLAVCDGSADDGLQLLEGIFSTAGHDPRSGARAHVYYEKARPYGFCQYWDTLNNPRVVRERNFAGQPSDEVLACFNIIKEICCAYGGCEEYPWDICLESRPG